MAQRGRGRCPAIQWTRRQHLDEEQRDESEDGAGGDGLEEDALRGMRHLVEGLMEVAHTETARDVKADHPRHERRIEHVVHQATQHEDFQPEDGAGDGRAENGGEAGADGR